MDTKKEKVVDKQSSIAGILLNLLLIKLHTLNIQTNYL